MARLYSDENFSLLVVEVLRTLGHDILTATEANQANLQIPDDRVLQFAIDQKRAILTRNRRDFIRLHLSTQADHWGIVVCTEDPDFEGLANRIHEAIALEESLQGQLIRVNRLPASGT